MVCKFNELRPQLLADATKNARNIAEEFATDSGTTVGRIHPANQGMMQIFSSGDNNKSGPYSLTSTPVKKNPRRQHHRFELKKGSAPEARSALEYATLPQCEMKLQR